MFLNNYKKYTWIDWGATKIKTRHEYRLDSHNKVRDEFLCLNSQNLYPDGILIPTWMLYLTMSPKLLIYDWIYGF